MDPEDGGPRGGRGPAVPLGLRQADRPCGAVEIGVCDTAAPLTSCRGLGGLTGLRVLSFEK